jgi:hypothetical protein
MEQEWGKTAAWMSSLAPTMNATMTATPTTAGGLLPPAGTINNYTVNVIGPAGGDAARFGQVVSVALAEYQRRGGKSV